jgi:hypothetical protein
VVYRGMHQSDAFWTVTCTNGKSYSVDIHSDARGSTRVLDCATLESVTHDSCFSKF